MCKRLIPLIPVTTALILVLSGGVRSAAATFFGDDPLWREPETEDASRAQPRETDLFYDFVYNSFAMPRRARASVRAINVNTVDEVPDSGWFTNRLVTGDLAADALTQGPNTLGGTRLSLQGPGRALTVVKAKTTGAAPGVVVRCADGKTWFLSFDPKGHPESATGALMAASRLFWAMGYNVPEHYLAEVRPDELVFADTATTRTMSGRERRMTRRDLDDVLARAERRADGSYRVAASRLVPGRVIGPFKYEGTRNDDPNDIIPHEHRRELRALQVFGAWTNLVDIKAGNTLDTIVDGAGGRSVVRHYLQDVGSTFGIGASGPHDYDEGFEHLYEGDALVRRLLTFGLYTRPWQTRAQYEEHPSIGRFEAEVFDPLTWRPRLPSAALLHGRPDDHFWAARRVAAFTDRMIAAAVSTAEFTDSAAARQLTGVLIERRDKIARAFLPAVNPLVDFALAEDGTLTFRNAAVDAGVAAAPPGYRAGWARFDNTTGETRGVAVETAAAATRLAMPSALDLAEGSYLRVSVRAEGQARAASSTPVDVTFRRGPDGWKTVGVDRN